MVSPDRRIVPFGTPDMGSNITDIRSRMPSDEVAPGLHDSNSPRRARQHFPATLSNEAREEMQRMRNLTHQSRIAFPDGTNNSASVFGPGNTLEPARPYFIRHGIDGEEVDALLTHRGEWRYTAGSEGPRLFELSPDELALYMRTVLAPIYRATDKSLDGLLEHGFNSHGEKHAKSVEETGLQLLGYVGANEEVMRNLTMAALLHDLGNLLGREAHPMISVRMSKAIFPGIERQDPENWRRISRAISLHDSDNLKSITSLRANLPTEERLESLADIMQPEGLALIIADNVEVGRDRLSEKLTVKGLQKDPHTLVNFLGSNAGVEPWGNSFVWNLDYDTTFTDDDRERFGDLIDAWEDLVSSGEEPMDFDKWKRSFVAIYGQRMIATAEAALAFFPSLKEVDIVMRDKGEGARRSREVWKLRRHSLESDSMRLRRKQESYKALLSSRRRG